MSLPWILMSHVLDSKDSFLIQCVVQYCVTLSIVKQFIVNIHVYLQLYIVTSEVK